jgi:CheY-like chemotaxis protein
MAEDNRINQCMAFLMLKKLGYGADTVADGKDVMSVMNRQPYEIILMNVQMPEMDGLYATQEIRITH